MSRNVSIIVMVAKTVLDNLRVDFITHIFAQQNKAWHDNPDMCSYQSTAVLTGKYLQVQTKSTSIFSLFMRYFYAL